MTPDPFTSGIDIEKFPYGVTAGNNKYKQAVCPICKSTGTEMKTEENSDVTLNVFLFTDHLSAREYRISGLCQDCQDKVFKEPEE